MTRPRICSYCGQLGHTASKCPRRVHTTAPSAIERWRADLATICRELDEEAGPRRPPNKAEIVATMALAIVDSAGAAIVTRDEARALDAAAIFELFRSRVTIDHIVPRIVGGPDHPANYQPLRRTTDNAVKTPRDQSEIAKTKRIRKAQAAHLRELLARASTDGEVERTAQRPAGKIKSRGFGDRSRPMPGSKASGVKRGFDGKVTRREVAP